MKTLVINYIFIVSVVLLYLPIELSAQSRIPEKPGRSVEAPGRNGVTPGQNKGAAGVPIDGGASALLAVGAAYGLKKLIDYRKQRKQIE